MKKEEITKKELLDELLKITQRVAELEDDESKDGNAVKEGESADDRFRWLFEASQQAIVFCDADGKIILANPASVKGLGFENPNELIGRHASEFYVKAEEREKMYEILRRDGFCENAEITFKRKDGVHLFALGTFIARKDESGRNLYVSAIFTNISKRKKVEEKLMNAINKSPIPTMFISGDGSIAVFNEALEELTGYHKGEIENSDEWSEKIYPDPEYRRYILESVVRTRQGASLGSTIFTITCKDGKTKTIDFKMSNFEGGYVLQLIDISEREKARKLIQSERDRANQYLNVAGVVMIALDANGNITLINQKGCQTLECEEHEMLGKNWFDHFITEDVKPKVKSVFINLMKGNIEPVEYFENTVLCKSGKKKIIAWHNTLLKDDVGNIVGTLSSGNDISEQRRAEIALKESEEKYRSLIEAACDPIFLIDISTGNILEANKKCECLTGLPCEKMIGKHHTILYPDEDREYYEGIFHELSYRHDGHKRVANVIHSEGHTIPVQISSSTIELNGNEFIIAIYRDISDLKIVDRDMKD